jgi:hypothetical protein
MKYKYILSKRFVIRVDNKNLFWRKELLFIGFSVETSPDEKTNDIKDSFYEELERVFNTFLSTASNFFGDLFINAYNIKVYFVRLFEGKSRGR